MICGPHGLQMAMAEYYIDSGAHLCYFCTQVGRNLQGWKSGTQMMESVDGLARSQGHVANWMLAQGFRCAVTNAVTLILVASDDRCSA
jgi:hypothetical protein